MTRSQLFAVTFAAIVPLLAASPAAATSASVREACTADAHRLCESVIHDAKKRHACMHTHAAQLSKGCIAVIRKSR